MIAVLQICLGIFMIVFALWPNMPFYRGRPGGLVGEAHRRPIKAQGLARMLFVLLGLAAILDSVFTHFVR